MKITNVSELQLHGAKLIQYQRHNDDRGYYAEIHRATDIEPVIHGFKIAQIGESFSANNVLRGLHFQWNPPAGKLVRVVYGSMWDFILDMRIESPTYGKAIAVYLEGAPQSDIGYWLWVPPGFAHGCAFTSQTVLEYLWTEIYNSNGEGVITPLAEEIDWSLSAYRGDEIIKPFSRSPSFKQSTRDKAGITLEQWQNHPHASDLVFREANA